MVFGIEKADQLYYVVAYYVGLASLVKLYPRKKKNNSLFSGGLLIEVLKRLAKT